MAGNLMSVRVRVMMWEGEVEWEAVECRQCAWSPVTKVPITVKVAIRVQSGCRPAQPL